MSEKYEGGQTVPSFIRDIYSPSSGAARVVDIPAKVQMLLEYDVDDNVIYKGIAARGSATTDSGWLIFKYTWSSGNCTEIKTADGAWDDRSSLVYL